MLNLRINQSRLLLFAALLLLSAAGLQTQQDDATYIFYYEDAFPNRLDVVLLMNNICLEAVLRLNPVLDINNIGYGDSMRVPIDEPCYKYDQSVYGWWNFSDGYPPRLKYYENGQWLAEPYYSDEVVYLRPDTLDAIVQQYNICLDDLLADNILLHDFERYKAYAYMTVDIFIPKAAPPCDPDWTPPTDPVNLPMIEMPAREATPLFFVQEYNICPEDIAWISSGDIFYRKPDRDATIMFSLPEDALPCYNEAGQRLSYFDEQGQRLKEPVYSELAVYRTAPEETLPEIAEKLGVCLIDLLRVNNFPSLPLIVSIELFVPPARPCPDDIEARQVSGRLNDLESISLDINICPKTLQALNPHFTEGSSYRAGWFLNRWIYRIDRLDIWILVPKTIEPCYWQYQPPEGTSIFDLELQLNVCYQEFRQVWSGEFHTFFARAAPPCYNQQGQRLWYPPSFDRTINNMPLSYSDMRIHRFRREDTVYSISQEYNVCVPDLLLANPILVGRMPTGYPTFIPDTRPCYDEATRMPLLYEDADGKPLDPPQVSDQLIYYGSQPLGYISSYYNVCENRITAVNQAKFDRKNSYLGWIIPTDRLPCFDADGNPIDYVCYDQPVDFAVDYRAVDPPLSFDPDGTYCYDLAEPETVIWQQNKPYQVINYFGTLLASRAFTAWCFGVDLAEMDAINDDPAVLALLPFQSRAIPLPTRPCYVQNPEILAGYDLHTVKAEETLSSIARRYDKPYQWIAAVNDLDREHTIWAGQKLIIPAGTTLSSVFVLVSRMIGLIVLLLGGCYWYRRRLMS